MKRLVGFILFYFVFISRPFLSEFGLICFFSFWNSSSFCPGLLPWCHTKEQEQEEQEEQEQKEKEKEKENLSLLLLLLLLFLLLVLLLVLHSSGFFSLGFGGTEGICRLMTKQRVRPPLFLVLSVGQICCIPTPSHPPLTPLLRLICPTFKLISLSKS